MNDRELLEMAAKAAGIGLLRSRMDDPLCRDYLLADRDPEHPGRGKGWNPLTDDGDALRLAVKLNITIALPEGDDLKEVGAWAESRYVWIKLGDDSYAATRLAIVSAAAELGKAKA